MQLSDHFRDAADAVRRRISFSFARRPTTIAPAPVISFTFDDFPRSAVKIGGKILREHGVVGTYFATFGLMNARTPAGPCFNAHDVRQLLAEGHELGSHTFSHCHAWDTAPVRFEHELRKNIAAAAQHALGREMMAMSYPISFPRPGNKAAAQRYHACCRGGGHTFNVAEVDANYIRAVFIEKCRDFAEIRTFIERTVRSRGWLVFATHDVSDRHSPFGCSPAIFDATVEYAVESGARVLAMGAAWAALTNPNVEAFADAVATIH